MTESTRTIFTGMQILIGHEWVKGQALVVEGETIKAILTVDMIKHHLPAKIHDFPSNYYLIPGLIDLHVHGARGADVMDNSTEALDTISRALGAEGITGFLATTMSASNDHIESVLQTIALSRASKHGAAILGVHLEGPFIAKAKMGAQRIEEGKLDIALIQRWQKLAHESIKLVTLAPELPGALQLIKALRQMGVVASVGHTDATYEETCAAIAAGCSHATHLFNAMRGLHQRAPGALGALLLSEHVTAELIVDGLHLHPAIVDLALRVKGKQRLLLITDAMRAKCLGDGEYELGGQTVSVRGGKAALADGTLAGSTLRMPQAIKNMVQFSQCALADAIIMASANPASVLGLSERKGSLAVGKDADVVIMNDKIDVVVTMRAGTIICENS